MQLHKVMRKLLERDVQVKMVSEKKEKQGRENAH